ncbi:MAG: septum formation protein Maf [Gemmatimonadetes bacterium]|nr:septum formation protein Maf [Gemmatimonadota bacterium]
MRDDWPRLVLASGSPRRLELLCRLGLSVEVRPPEIDESLLPDERPEAAAERLGRAKALRAAGPGALSLGCDTLVVHGGAILGKPGSPAAAAAMLERLSGQQHVVLTGIALATPDRIESAVEATRVWLRPLSTRECEEYVATGEPLDKAGAYGIQGLGAAIVERIDGDYFNVMGLPVRRLLELFERFDLRYAFGELVPLEPAGDEAQNGEGG